MEMTKQEAVEMIRNDTKIHHDYLSGQYRKALNMAIDALLKEQEPQLVLNIGEQISCKSGSCPKCGKMLNTTCNKRYCGDCGQEVKWDGQED